MKWSMTAAMLKLTCRLVIAEDQSDMREFIAVWQIDIKSYWWRWKRCLDKIPATRSDLVISDLMMPDWMATSCKKIKTMKPPATSAILLTARADQQSNWGTAHRQMITWPPSMRGITGACSNLIAQREKLKVLFAHRAAPFTPAPIPHPKKFSNKVITLGKQVFQSAIRGGWPWDRHEPHAVALQTKALPINRPVIFYDSSGWTCQKLLAVKGVSVSEAAWQSGFNNLPNFSRLFKAWAGVTPSEFQQNEGSASPSVTNQQDIVTNS